LGLKPIKCITIKIYRDGRLIQTLHTDEEGRAYTYLTRGLYRFEYWDGDRFLGEVTKYINRATNVHFHQVWKYPPPPFIERVLAPYLAVETILGELIAKELVPYAQAIPSLETWAIPAYLDLVKEVEVTANTTEIDITGLDINTHKLYLILIIWKNAKGLKAGLKVYIEGDFTDTNYYFQTLYADGTSKGGVRYNSPMLTLGDIVDMAFYMFYLVRDIDGKGRLFAMGLPRVGGEIEIHLNVIIHTIALANITRITLKCTKKFAIGVGSKVQIYGCVE